MALKLNEGRACEAIVRHLEKREKVTRTNLRFPEQEQHASPIEAAFALGDRRYALEHTGIEPFEGHMKMEAQADQRFTPIIDGLNGELDTTATFELAIPAEAFEGRKDSERKDIQERLIEWVKASAPTIPKPLLRGYRGRSTGSENVTGVPFAVYLSRYEPVWFQVATFKSST